jgi:hypothetical protein
MKRSLVYISTVLLVIIIGFLAGRRCNAIPAFARKYQISCQVCHSPVMPRLKGFGEEFAGNGFRMTDYESPRYFIPTGDDKLSLFRELPLAIRLDGFASYNFNKEGKSDFAAPFIVKILSGGELSEKLSYYFYFLMNERGSIVGVEDAFLMYHDILKSGINFYIGQFQASDPLFKGELRYTLEPYKIYDAAPGNSSVSLKYERGMMLEKGFSSGTTVLAEIVNGSGIGEAGENFIFDKDKHKNFMLRLSQSLGENVSLGIFGYTGKEDLNGHPGSTFTSQIKMFGPDLKLNFSDKFILNLQYVRRTDSEVFLEYSNLPKYDVLTHGGFAELIFSPKGDMSKWYLTGLVNYVESELDELDYRAATLHAGYLVRRNFRFVTEYTWQFTGNSYGKVNAGFITAF